MVDHPSSRIPLVVKVVLEKVMLDDVVECAVGGLSPLVAVNCMGSPPSPLFVSPWHDHHDVEATPKPNDHRGNFPYLTLLGGYRR